MGELDRPLVRNFVLKLVRKFVRIIDGNFVGKKVREQERIFGAAVRHGDVHATATVLNMPASMWYIRWQ